MFAVWSSSSDSEKRTRSTADERRLSFALDAQRDALPCVDSAQEYKGTVAAIKTRVTNINRHTGRLMRYKPISYTSGMHAKQH